MTTAYQGNEPYIFLSYAHADKELAHQVVDYLHEHNFKVWFDEGIHTGAQWKKFILEKIANPNCWMMVFLATQNSLVSDECEKELYFAEKKKKKFINVVIGSPQFPDWFICDFTRYQFVNEAEFASSDAMMVKLVEELIHHQMDPNKPKDTPRETPKETPKAKAPEVAKVPKVSVPTQKRSEPSATPKGPLKLSTDDGLQFTVTDGTATVTGYTGTETKVIIPAKITYDGNSYKVTSIGDRAFYGCSSLTSITIPDSVTSIGSGAFYRCSSLTSITIPNSVTSIGEWAFEWCENLTSITIPNGVTTIGNLAFFWCENLTSINVDKNNSHYKSIDGNLYTKDGSTLIQYAIGKTATSFTIPNSVTSIGAWAFSLCKNLTSVTIPDGVTSIGDLAFCHCSALTTITIPKSITSIGNGAFKWCDKLTSITIPDSVTTIGDLAFKGCENLTSITIPDSVTAIGEDAFGDCESLTIYCEAKSKPSNWHTDWNSSNRPVVWGHGSSEQPTAPKGPLKLVTDDGLKFTVTDGTATVSDYTGTDSKVIIPSAITYNGKTYKVTAIGDWAFEDCFDIDEITIPNSVTSIGRDAFMCCENLASIFIPNSVTSIGERAFYDCSSLTSIAIPDGVTSIGESAFECCENLTIFCEAKSKPRKWHANWNPDNRPVVWGGYIDIEI